MRMLNTKRLLVMGFLIGTHSAVQAQYDYFHVSNCTSVRPGTTQNANLVYSPRWGTLKAKARTTVICPIPRIYPRITGNIDEIYIYWRKMTRSNKPRRVNVHTKRWSNTVSINAEPSVSIGKVKYSYEESRHLQITNEDLSNIRRQPFGWAQLIYLTVELHRNDELIGYSVNWNL